MDLADVERVLFNARGGADVVTIHDLTRTPATEVVINLADFTGFGDGQPDSVIVHGTQDDDLVTVSGIASQVTVAGLSALVQILNSEGADDQLLINTLGGDDVIDDASGLPSGVINLSVDGGSGDNVVIENLPTAAPSTLRSDVPLEMALG